MTFQALISMTVQTPDSIDLLFSLPFVVNDIVMRTFLVNFIYTSASHSYNADFVLFTQETFPTSHEIYKHIKATAVARGLQVQGPILWSGITELSESDERQFKFVEE
jgi:hypothetical protein